MKLLLDQHLSWRMVERLADLWPDSQHTSQLGLGAAPDSVVWQAAKLGGYTLVTKDADFCALSTRFGRPPLVVWLKVPNGDVEALVGVLRCHEATLRAADADLSVHLLEIGVPGQRG